MMKTNKFLCLFILLIGFDRRVFSNSRVMSLFEDNVEKRDEIQFSPPRGGSLNIGVQGTFDTLLWFKNGLKPKGIEDTYETLMKKSLDELMTYYPLIAESYEVADDISHVIFYLNKIATWNDGDPITSDDIVSTFNFLMKESSLALRAYYEVIKEIVKIDDKTVKFIFKEKENKMNIFITCDMPILQSKTLEKTNGKPFLPSGGGAYLIDDYEYGRFIRYKKNNSSWTQNTNLNKGINNFDYITYYYYKEEESLIKALITMEVDLLGTQITMEGWKSIKKSKKVKEEKIIIQDMNRQVTSSVVMGLFINTRKHPFNNIKVREALNYLFDFNFFNEKMFSGQYRRVDSYFAQSDMHNLSDIPEGKELEILNKYKDSLPDELFTKKIIIPNSDPSENFRENIFTAIDLFAEAGWKMFGDKLIDKNGEQMKIEVIDNSKASNKFLNHFSRTLEKIGIDVTIKIPESSNFRRRLYEFDYDLIAGKLYIPSILFNYGFLYWHSKNADIQGTKNFSGIKNHVIDSLLEEMKDYYCNKEMSIAFTNAINRVLLFNSYIIPYWYTNTSRIAYWDKFEVPEHSDRYSIGIEKWQIKK